jgi:chromosome partitioning protein
MLGLKILHEYVNQMADIDPKPEFNIVLNGIPRQGYQTNVEDELRADPEFGPRVLTSKLYESKILAASADYTGFATDKKVPYRGRVRDNVLEVVAELAGVWKL